MFFESSPQDNSSGLDSSMSGMSLMNTWKGTDNRAPAQSMTPLSNGSSPNSDRNRPFPPFGGTENTNLVIEAPVHPESPIQRNSFQTRPPVLGSGISLPSPVRPSNNQFTSAESPILSRTPPSSLEGNLDIFSKPSSPFFEAAPPSPNIEHQVENSRILQHRLSGSLPIPAQENGRVSSIENNIFLPPKSVDYNEALSNSFSGGIFSRGNFDTNDNEDGLGGLGALRDRAQSSPGLFNTSQHYGNGSFSSSPLLYSGNSGEQKQPSMHVRTTSGSRPPRSGAAISTGFGTTQDSSSYGSSLGDRSLNQSFQSQGSQRGRDSNFSSGDINGNFRNQGGFGSLPRPDMQYLPSDGFDDVGMRGRSTSLGGLPHHFGENRESSKGASRGLYNDPHHLQQPMDQHHQSQLGSSQTPNSYLQQQQVQSPFYHSHIHQQQSQQQGGCSNTFSASGNLPNVDYGGSHDDFNHYGRQHGNERQYDMDSEYMYRSQHESDHVTDDPRHTSIPQNGHIQRSVSAGADLTQGGASKMLPQNNHQSQPSLSGPLDGNNPYHGAPTFQPRGGQQHPYGSQKREITDIQGRSQRYDDAGVPVMISQEELMVSGMGHDGDHRGSSSFRQERSSHSPLNVHVAGQHGGNIRQYSEHRAQNQNHTNFMPLHQQRVQSFDNDLTHPLAGEHIDDPGDDIIGSMNKKMLENSSKHLNKGRGSPHLGHRSSYSDPSLDHVAPIMHPDSHSGPAPVAQYNPAEPTHGRAASSGSVSSGPRVVYTVKFKRTQRSFIPGPRVTRDLKTGCYVKVEADRGEDLGIIIGKIPAEKFNTAGKSSFRSSELTAGVMPPSAGVSVPGAGDLKRIIRNATHDEVGLLAVKRDEEEELLKICRRKVLQRALPMTVVDAEYQFDRHKLVFFFEAEGRIDFRELVRDLFSMYKTRIWMQQLDKNGTGHTGAGGTTPPTGSVDGANPIIPSLSTDNTS